jgi:hypothetical protein
MSAAARVVLPEWDAAGKTMQAEDVPQAPACSSASQSQGAWARRVILKKDRTSGGDVYTRDGKDQSPIDVKFGDWQFIWKAGNA